MPRLTMPRQLLLAVVAAVVVSVPGATPASAHIDPDPTEAPAGSLQSIGFTVEHGCDGSPTVRLDMRLPDGVRDPVPEPPPGWTGSVAETADGVVVTFEGGPLPDDVEGTFRVQMLLPRAEGATLYFPFVQRCEVGEIRWIDVPTEASGGELDEPAPALLLTAELPGTTDPPPPTSSAPATTTAATTAPTPTSEPTPTEPAPTATTATSTDAPVPSSEPASDGGRSSTGVVVGIVAVLAVAAGVAVVVARRSRSRR
jgi:uncharacterized protein YcnI